MKSREEDPETTQACCGGAAKPIAYDVSWTDGVVASPAGPVPRARTTWSKADRRGRLRARLTIGRMRYAVPPGLYAVGNPDPSAPVFVSANYKLSFDHLRRALDGIDGWILVLDTAGVNVWCAAGKGTFGTAELLARIQRARLADVVSHRTLIVPQLGASGVSAPVIQKESGFRVIYGPVRASDIPNFLKAGLTATDEMRRVRFDLVDRITLVPTEIITWAKFAVPFALLLLLAGGIQSGGYDFSLAWERGLRAAILVLAAWLAGALLVPILLPWIPGRPFSIKGALLGLVLVLAALFGGAIPLDVRGMGLRSSAALESAAWLFMAPAIAAFQALNFTGSTTFTSLSGVKREMRFAVPAEISLMGLGLIAWAISLFGS